MIEGDEERVKLFPPITQFVRLVFTLIRHISIFERRELLNGLRCFETRSFASAFVVVFVSLIIESRASPSLKVTLETTVIDVAILIGAAHDHHLVDDVVTEAESKVLEGFLQARGVKRLGVIFVKPLQTPKQRLLQLEYMAILHTVFALEISHGI